MFKNWLCYPVFWEDLGTAPHSQWADTLLPLRVASAAIGVIRCDTPLLMPGAPGARHMITIFVTAKCLSMHPFSLVSLAFLGV